MKLIIDIPEVYYEALSKTEEIISSQRSGKTLMSVIYSAVGNGTPLDDVKAEIEKQIESDFAFAKIESLNVPCHYGIANGLQNAIRIIDNAVSKNCKNLSESYGEICVKCNKCGRFDKAESEGE